MDESTIMSTIINTITTLVVSIIASSGFWTLIKYRYVQKDNVNKQREMQSNLLLGLAHDRIVYLGMKYVERGWITNDEYENLREYLFKPYSLMGGNGSANRVMTEVDRLKIVPSSHNQTKPYKE